MLGNLCESGRSWQDTMLSWFDGRVGCQETKRYLDNFFAVTRTRPEEVGLAMCSVCFPERVQCLFFDREWDLKMTYQCVVSILIREQKLFQVSLLLRQHSYLTPSVSTSASAGSSVLSRCSVSTLSASMHTSQHHPEHVFMS